MTDRIRELSEATSGDLIRWSRDGDEDAASILYSRYVERLTRLANRHINDKYAARMNADDVVQSIFRTVWRVTRDRKGDMEFTDDTGFWKWLVTIGLNKIYKKIAEANAAKRSVDREVPETAVGFSRSVCERSPTPGHVAEVADLFESILRGLEPLEQEILQYRLAGFSQTEIADELDVDPRTIRRRMYNIRETASTIMDAELPPSLQ